MYYNLHRFPRYRPIYRLNINSPKKYNVYFPYLINKFDREKINSQVFYNTIHNNKKYTSPQSSALKYTISIGDIEKPSYLSISEKQKRLSLNTNEHFENLNNNYKYHNCLTIFILLLFIIFILL